MKRASCFAVVLASLLVSAPPITADICVNEKLKPLRHVCGHVVDLYGRPIANAKLKILRSGAEFETAETRDDGEFSFGRLDAGNYEIQAGATGFTMDRYPIVVVKPDASCKQALRIQLRVGTECSHIRIERGSHTPHTN